MPFFSVIVPAYNAEKYIEKTLLSLLNQSFRDYEIIVVDDGSTDNSDTIINKYKSGLTYIKQANSGPAAARNAGVEIASGQYIVSFDSDDLLFPFGLDVYSKVIKYFNYPPFIFSRMHYFFEDEEKTVNNPIDKIECIKHLNFFKKQSTVGISNSNMIIKKDSLVNAGGYEPDSYNFDDRCLAFRLGIESPLIQIIQPETVGHREHQVGISKNTDFLTLAALNIVNKERKNNYPGGTNYKFDRRGLIGTNLLFLFAKYFGVKNTADILRIALRARFMLVQGIIRKFISRKYHTDIYTIGYSE